VTCSLLDPLPSCVCHDVLLLYVDDVFHFIVLLLYIKNINGTGLVNSIMCTLCHDGCVISIHIIRILNDTVWG